ncbi:MAG: phytoene/squalene synthase family protein [Sphingobacteriaceae bacterium]|nr:phytoene/squalene synthase family protein [Sphingobacteriaceae bacterium]
MLSLYRKTNIECSRIITRNYSTSFSMGILAFDKKYRDPIYAIYGFVRYADEIVDTFHDFDKRTLLEEFKRDTYLALERGISLNPVLDSFQDTVKHFGIEMPLIDAFLKSMEMDLQDIEYAEENYTEYIYGSAEVVGLMCLRVFCDGDTEMYDRLTPSARHLGAAFQKVNFLRDIKDDYLSRGRTYFPNVNLGIALDETAKLEIQKDIELDFDKAYAGIIQLPKGSRIGVLTAYRFYRNLFNKICKVNSKQIMESRVRVSNAEKAALLVYSMMSNKLNML